VTDHTLPLLAAEVDAALRSGDPVVALESTVLTHGVPPAERLAAAAEMQAAVRAGGALPAVIALLGGEPRIGLAREELERLCAATSARKAGSHELAAALLRGEDAGTTVSATLHLAHRAGIRVFATGGIGGVHHGVPHDESLDLLELSRTPLVVVCAGPKAVLDLAATRERLETLGVLVAGYRTAELPAFYHGASDLPVDEVVASPAEVAALWSAQRRLGLAGALLLCQPPPADAALDAESVEEAVGRALRDTVRRGVRGKEVTPFLLEAVRVATGGRSLDTNRALLAANARLGGEVAAAIAAG
jgi:pseudouridylate synthase